MTKLTEKAEQWPRRKNNELVFKTTHEAIFYANLIYDHKRLVDEIDMLLRSARRQLADQRQTKEPNLDRLMNIAVKGQFFRECLDEVKRIREEQ